MSDWLLVADMPEEDKGFPHFSTRALFVLQWKMSFIIFDLPYRVWLTYCLHVMPYGNPLRWRQNGRDSVSNHQTHDCLLNRLFRRRSKKTSKLRVTGLCAGNSPGTDEFPAQMASNAENVSIWWRHHGHSLKPHPQNQYKIFLKTTGASFTKLVSKTAIATRE